MSDTTEPSPNGQNGKPKQPRPPHKLKAIDLKAIAALDAIIDQLTPNASRLIFVIRHWPVGNEITFNDHRQLWHSVATHRGLIHDNDVLKHDIERRNQNRKRIRKRRRANITTGMVQQTARLMADGSLTIKQIGTEVGVSSPTLMRIRNHPEFPAALEHWRKVYGDAAQRVASASVINQLKKYQSVIDDIAAICRDRAIEHGKNGWLCKQLKSIGAGEAAQVIEEYKADTALMDQLFTALDAVAARVKMFETPGPTTQVNVQINNAALPSRDERLAELQQIVDGWQLPQLPAPPEPAQ